METPGSRLIKLSEKLDKRTANSNSSLISTNYLGFEERKSNELLNASLRRLSNQEIEFRDQATTLNLQNSMKQLFLSAEQIYGDDNANQGGN